MRHAEEQPLHRLLAREVAPALQAFHARRVRERLRPVRRHHVPQALVGLEPTDDDQDRDETVRRRSQRHARATASILEGVASIAQSRSSS